MTHALWIGQQDRRQQTDADQQDERPGPNRIQDEIYHDETIVMLATGRNLSAIDTDQEQG